MAGSCKIHGISVGRERDDAFVMFGIDTAFGQFGTLPSPLFIFFREENKKSIAYSLEFGANDRTLTDEEINNILEKIIANLTKNGAEIRK